MKFGSICSGIEAASAAWHPLGWSAAWFSEIEPFPSAVLKHHYPEVPNLGDMTTLPDRILSGEVEAPDVLVGGTPCQAFSVAGLRNSLADKRGNLSLTFIEIANAIDHVRTNRGQLPCIVVWENVPGVYSTKDNAFGCFLAGMVGEGVPLQPAGRKWTNAGAVFGAKRTAAWRTLDAQYFGVAQRRRRCFLVSSARTEFNPHEVLFEFEGVRRDTPPSREAGQGFARTSGTLTANGGGLNRPAGNANELDFCIPAVVSASVGSLCARTGRSISVQDAAQGHLMPSWWDGGQTAATITTKSDDQRMPDKANAQLVMQPIAFPANLSGTQCAATENLSPAMGAKNPTAVAAQMAVRRLTPVECERLQGFNDNYTAIPWRGKPANDCPDGSRYKALGNSMAVPVMRWIGTRINDAVSNLKADNDNQKHGEFDGSSVQCGQSGSSKFMGINTSGMAAKRQA